jgi:hypothetical protein
MEYEQLLFEIKQLADQAEAFDYELANDLRDIVNQYDTTKCGDCCG